jgi:hypothetical protein
MASIIVDDLFTDDAYLSSHWTNIQDPVRQTLTGLTKTLNTHNKEIVALANKLTYMCSTEQTHALLRETEGRTCSKDDALQMCRRIEHKAESGRVDSLEGDLKKVINMCTLGRCRW